MQAIQPYKLISTYRFKTEQSQSKDKVLPRFSFVQTQDVFVKSNDVNFTSRCPKIPQISDFKEYEEVIKRVCNSKTIYGEKFWSIDCDFNKYSGIKPEYIGLLPYCGGADVSYYINKFLRNQMNFEKFSEQNIASSYTPTRESIVDIISALDYSLSRLDEEFGKYSGVVFRKGVFKPKSKQFNSSTLSSAIAVDFSGFSPKSGYSVIRTKNGHKICDFQAAMNSKYANTEKEILLPRTAKYIRLYPYEYDEEILNAQDKLARDIRFAILDCCSSKEIKQYTDEKIKNLIKVYEEL